MHACNTLHVQTDSKKEASFCSLPYKYINNQTITITSQVSSIMSQDSYGIKLLASPTLSVGED